MRPNVFTAAATIASTSAGLATSPITAKPAPPAANSSAMARPMLRPAPVTTATRPSSSFCVSVIPSSSECGEIDPAGIERGGELERRSGFRIIPAAVPAAQGEFVLDVATRQRLVGAAAHVRLALLDDAAVIEHGPDVAGI